MTSQEINDLSDRTFPANNQPVQSDRAYVLVVLNRALRAHDNPVIDAAAMHARQLNLSLVVYSELDYTVPHASERICYFVLGAFKELAIALQAKKIKCVQGLKSAENEDILRSLCLQAAAIYTDQDYTIWDRAKIQRVLDVATVAVFAVDASRLVPTRQLPANLKTTPEFRKAHGKLRDRYLELRKSINQNKLINKVKTDRIPITVDHNFALYEDKDLVELVQSLDVDHKIKISQQHLPKLTEIEARMEIFKTKILKPYKWNRNNPALEYSTSQLSPYLHFGMISPHQVLAEVESTEIPKSYTYKFRDEFLTWREWSHYLAFHTYNLHEYDALPEGAKQTLEDHAHDPRPDLTSFDNIIQGNTPDRTWNAAQREWRNCGWLHNNLRMYWAKQILRFTETPQQAWDLACYLNDHISLDGRDPATYASMQWAFGNAKLGYSEKEIYGWVAPKSDRTLLKREGMKEWIQARI